MAAAESLYLPLFPLQIVVFPGESLNLHIFEDRYKQMIRECCRLQKPFGIPSVIGGKLQEFGTSLVVLSVEKIHDNGEMDIRTTGGRIFRILEYMDKAQDLPYPAGVVTFHHAYAHDRDQGNARPEILNQLKDLLSELMSILEIEKNILPSDGLFVSYRIAHYLNMPLQMEYDLLLIADEDVRQQVMIRFLREIIPDIARREEVRKKISLNGHFKHLPPPIF